MYQAGLIGVTGYTGMELARILATHPNIALKYCHFKTRKWKIYRRTLPFFTFLSNRKNTNYRF